MVRSLIFVLLTAGSLFAQADKPLASQLPNWVRVEANVSYGNYLETVLDVLQPARAGLTKRPGVLVIHGGGWVGGTKEGMIEPHCLRYLEEGFVVANVEYRLAKAAPAAVTDVLAAAAWFRRNAARYNVDPERIVVTGAASGGHLSLMVGMTRGSKVGAVVNFYGITDVADLLSGPNQRDYAVTWLPEQDGRLELAKRVSPMSYIRRDLPPILTIHGDADDVVPYSHGLELTQALKVANATGELITIKGGKHGGFGDKQMDKIYRDIFKFLHKRGIIQ